MKIKKIIVVLFCFCGFLTASCAENEGFMEGAFSRATDCPYMITNYAAVNGEEKPYYNFAAAFIEVYNKSEKKIRSFSVSFCVYNSQGVSPFVGSNTVMAEIDAGIEKKEKQTFVISLDEFISVVPEEPYDLDFIYLMEVVFEDGSVWRDPYGMYATKEYN